MPFLDTRHKKKSFTLTTALLSALILLLFYIGLTYLAPEEENGIAINFGATNFGSGRTQPAKPKVIPPPKYQEQKVETLEKEEAVKSEPLSQVPQTEEAEEKVLTQESEESIRLKQQAEAKRRAEEVLAAQRAEAEKRERLRKEAEAQRRQEEAEKKEKLDALISGIGKADGTSDEGKGDDTRVGDKGNPDGNPYATTYYGAPGSGNNGSYGLSGRSLVNRGKVQQQCNEDGRVVVRIVVDRNGKVIKATPGVKGTTNTAPCLLEPAQKTALMHQWNLDANAPAQQIGFVVVNFKLGQ